MKKKLNFKIIILFSLLCCFCNSEAAHLYGGEISYTWLSGNTYEVKLTYYRDCDGVSAPGTLQINVSSSVCNVLIGITLSPISGTPSDIQNICPAVNSTCHGGTEPGIEKWIYTGLVTLPSNCPDYYFSYTECCRLSHFPNPDENAFYFATLDNFNVVNNNSPQFISDPIHFLITGHDYTINNGAIDLDGDSLVYSLEGARKDSSTFINYLPGYSFQAPFTSATPIYLNSTTGDFSVHPLYQEASNVVFHVKEYRNGLQVGSTSRDIRIYTLNNSNSPPSLSGINNSPYFEVHACAGDTIRFNVSSKDAEISDSTKIFWSTTGLGLFSVNSSGGIRDSVSVELITDSNMIGSNSYQLRLSVKDNSCPAIAYQSYTYRIYIDGCGSNIWPGDANSDLECNLYDVFPIGIAYGTSGPVRSGATSNWVAQSNSNWTQSFASHLNYKHADCNGDGTVDSNDLGAISQNFGETHLLRLSNPNLIASTDFASIKAIKDSARSGDTISVEIKLGDSANPINSIYGIAFQLNFDASVLDSIQNPFEFIQSTLGTPGFDMISLVRTDWQNGKIYAAAVRTDHNDVSSDSTIAIFRFMINNNAPIDTISGIHLSEVRGIDANDSIHSVNSISDTIVINPTTVSLNSTSDSFKFNIYPNPAQNNLFISTNVMRQKSVILQDIQGRVVQVIKMESLNSNIDISRFDNGIYSIAIKSDLGLYWKKLIVSK